MTETKARDLAKENGGVAHQTGGNHWLVIVDLPSGAMRVIDESMDCVYLNRESYEWGEEPVCVHFLDGE